MAAYPETVRLGDVDVEATLLPHVYAELRSIAGALVRRNERRGLEPTELG